MSLPRLSVKRPVTAMMCCIAAVLLGTISWSRLPQELFPPITYPQISVVTFYKDAAPEEIEILITKLIEEQVGTVSGVRRISSTSKEERSLVVAEFAWDTHMDFAALNVREKIDLVKEKLPRGADDSIVIKFNPFELPVIVLNISGNRSPQKLLQLTRKAIKNEIEKIDGVASVTLSGGIEREILVEIDQGRLQATGTSITHVVDALSKANLNYPAGTIKETFYEQLIRTIGEFELVDEIRELPVGVDEGESFFEPDPYEGMNQEEANLLKEENKKLILIKDIGEVFDTTQERSSISRHNGRENISISVLKRADANTVRVAGRIRRAVENLKKDLPDDIEMKIAYDQSSFVKQALSGVVTSGMQGGVLAFFVLLAFLRSARSAAVVAATIPVSVLITFSLMFFQGISLNIISLGGLALGIGMLVDNGIVVIENIVRRRHEGNAPAEAAISGAGEVSGAITSSTLTTIVVFLPMVFVIGIAGQLFKELALTVTYSLIGSLAVALVFIPPVMRRMLGGAQKKVVAPGKEQGPWVWIRRFYSRILVLFLRFKYLGLVGAAGLFAVSLLFLAQLDKEFLPRIDQGQFVIKVNMLPGTKLEVTDSVVSRIETLLMSTPEIDNVTVNIGSAREKDSGNLLETLGVHQAQILVSLIPKAPQWGVAKAGQRKLSTQDVIQKIKKRIDQEPMRGAEIEYVAQESVFQSAFTSGKPIVVKILGQELAVLEKISKTVANGLTSIKGVYGVQTSLAPSSPETKVNVLKDRATSYRLSVSDIALAAQTAIEGYTATEYKEEGHEIDLRVRLREEDRKSLSTVRRLTVHSPLGMDVPLSEVAYLTIGKGPTEIKHQDQQRVILLSADLYGRSLSDAAKDIKGMLETMDIPDGYDAVLTGESEETQESFKSLQFALILSIILVYMIMAAQFESLWQPFIIMFTIPLSLIGVVFALIVTQTPLSIMVILGVIVLGGVVVNNGIVLIDLVNALRLSGKSSYESVVEASALRLRPILMTSTTTVLGLLPLAMGINQGAELQIPMAITVMGGLLVSTFLSLVVVPAVYLVMEGAIRFFQREKRQPALAGAPAGIGLAHLPGLGSPTREEPLPSDEKDLGEITIISEKEKREIEEETLLTPESPKPEPLPEEQHNLNPRQQQFLEDLKNMGRMTRAEYAARYTVSVPTAARDLKELTDLGFIMAHGPLARGRYYTLKRRG